MKDVWTAGTGSPSVTDQCRRLAELLELDAVGVVTGAGRRRHVAWWATPGSPPLPRDLDAVLKERTPGWVVCHLEGGSAVFARLTDRSSPRSREILKAIGASLASEWAASARSENGVPSPTPHADSAPRDLAPARLRSALASVCARLGFQTAALFAPGLGGWELIERVGPARPWHAVLDPEALGGGEDVAVYPDARTIPGLGARLAGMGCGSVAMLSLPDDARLILDAEAPMADGREVEEVRPFLQLMGATTGGLVDTLRSRRFEAELSALRRVAQAVRGILAIPGAMTDDLLQTVREALGADELFHLVDGEGGVDVTGSPDPPWPRRVPDELRAGLASQAAADRMEEATARQLGVVLGARSPFLSGAVSDTGGSPEAVLGGWRRGPGPSPEGMRLVAELLSTARSAIASRREVVDTLMLRERTRWAYEIHDGLTQTVTTAVLELEALKERIERDPREAIRVLASTKAEVRKALAELRALLFDLSEDRGPDPRGEEPLTKYVHDVVRRWRLPARVSIEGDLRAAPKRLLGVAYVVIREALANAAKHSGAGSISVRVSATTERVEVRVADTGRGFRPQAVARNGRHFGLEMIRKRVAEVGGTLDIRSAPGKGTEVIAHLPMGGAGG